MNKDLYLVRHGQTIFNLKRIIQGWSDSPLTQLGCDQAARAGMFLRARGIEPDHAYTSTLHRTEQTIANLCRAWRTSAWTVCASGSLATLRPSA